MTRKRRWEDYGVVESVKLRKADVEYLRQLHENHPEWSPNDLDTHYRSMTGRPTPGLKYNPRTYYNRSGAWDLEPQDISKLEEMISDKGNDEQEPKKVLIFVGEDKKSRLDWDRIVPYGLRDENEARKYGFAHVGKWFQAREKRLAKGKNFVEPIIVAVDRVSRINKELMRRKNIAKVVFIGHSGVRDGGDGYFSPGMDSLIDTNISVREGANNVHPADLYWGNLTPDAEIEVVGCESSHVAQDISDASGKAVIGTSHKLNFQDTGQPFFRPTDLEDGKVVPLDEIPHWEIKYPKKKKGFTLLGL